MEDLIIRVLSGEASEAERRTVERWRDESAENEGLFQEFLHTWRLGALHDPQERIPAPPPVERIIELAEQRRRHATPLKPAPSPRRRAWRWAAAAAAVLLAAGLGSLRIFQTPESITTTGPEDIRTMALADGSIVRLGPDSELRVRGDDTRTVRLNGVAFFGVVSDSGRPFVVETPAGRAEVLGTRFEIRSSADSLRLVVVEGRVGLSGAGRNVEARAGEVSRIAGGGPSEPESVDVWKLLDWPEGLLIFQATPLQQALEEVAAAFDMPLVIADSALARRSVTAWFEDEPVEEVVTTICQVVGARCTVGSTIEVAR
ncbi:MAG: FecR domain-containing protein [Gemmatimonadota bacterium]|nr:MAG: FecR domain-containing protein [Gemmatimonadota bacterium]